MSRASAKRRKKAQERAQSTYSSFNASAQALMAQMKALQKSNSGVIYSPGLPLQPQPGVNPEGQPRQYSFPLAYNTSVVDRTQGRADIPPFQQLRYLAKMYSGITLPERVWLDMVPGLTLKIGLTPEMKAQGYDDKDFQDDIDVYRRFFEKPDKRLDYHSWLRKALRSQTQIDEVYVYKRRTRGGQLYALELVDGSTMKPLLDDWGRIPEPPNFAFQQYLWGGLPGDWFSTNDMLHYQESPQDDSPFGFSRVERFIMEVNQALRKKQRDLAMFTEGNIPPGIMEVPESSNWTPDDIAKFQKLWNSLKAGNPAEQVRMQFTQPGMKYIKLDNGEILTDFDYFLYKISCGCYGISLADIGFVEDIHKSSDKGQQSMLYRRTLNPLVVMYAKLFYTGTIRNDFKDPRFEASFTGYEEEEDVVQLATAYEKFTDMGAIAPSDVAHRMGYPDVPKTGPFVMGKDGPIFLKDYEEDSDLRNAQKQAQMAGMQLAAQNPGGSTEGDQNDKENKGTEDGQEDLQQKQEKTPQKAGGKGAKAGVDQAKETGSSTRPGEATRAAQSMGTTVHTGIMIAFMLDEATASRLALPGGEPAGDLHITLAYLGDTEEQPEDDLLRPHTSPFKIKDAITSVAKKASPLTGTIGGIGRFTPAETEETPVIALVDVPGLTDLRTKLVEAIEGAGYFVANNHGYTPHVTLTYIDSDAPMPDLDIDNVPLDFGELCLVVGDERYYFPIGAQGQSLSNNQEVKAEFRRWRTRAIEDVKLNKMPRHFSSALIPLDLHRHMDYALIRCKTPDEVRAVFKAAQEGDTSFFEQAVGSGGHPRQPS